MTTTAWVMIGCTLLGQILGMAWWLVRRPVGRIDRLEAAVFGESGVNMRLNRYVTTEAFEKRMGTIDLHLRGVSDEGQKREERILAAIHNQTLVVGSEVRELKADVRDQVKELRSDVRSQADRVDAFLARTRDPR